MSYYIVVEVDQFLRQAIDKTGRPNKYGEPKKFETHEAAKRWIDKRTYPGMSFHYEVKEVTE